MSTLLATDQITITPAAALSDPVSWVKTMQHFLTEAATEGRTVRVVAEEIMLTPQEAAEALDISRSSVQRAIAAGDMKAMRRGTHYRIAESEVGRYRQHMLHRMSKVMADAF